MAAKKPSRKKDGFVHRFESAELLGELLGVAGSVLSVEEVVEIFRGAITEGRAPGDVIPELFDGEPQFPDPGMAQLTVQNLLGLWDLLAEGKPLPRAKTERPPRPKKPQPAHPGAYAEEGPDEAWVESAWRYLEDIPDRERTRLQHAFDNRQDALVTWLDDSGLPDDGYLAARHLVFELHAMIELGWNPGVTSVGYEALQSGTGGDHEVPWALRSYVDEAIHEAEHDDESPLSPSDAARAREIAERALRALWNARRRGST